MEANANRGINAMAGPSNTRCRVRRTMARPATVTNAPDRTVEVSQPGDRIRYRATFPIMVLAFNDNHEAAVCIPPAEVFEVVGRAQDDRFSIVNVRGEEFLVFDTDLKRHGVPVPE